MRAAHAAVRAETGGRPLTMDPEDAALRERWQEAYEAELAQNGTSPESSPESPPPGMFDDTEGADNDPDTTCTQCSEDPPGSLRVFFIHEFDDTPIASMDVQLTANGETTTQTTDANGMVSLDGIPPGGVVVMESSIRNDLPQQATRTQPNNRYFHDRAAVAWIQDTNSGHDRAYVMAHGASNDTTVVVSEKTTYVVYRKRKVYEIGIFAHVENVPAEDLDLGTIIGHTFLTVQVPGSSGSLGTHTTSAGLSYSGEIARGFWPTEGVFTEEVTPQTKDALVNGVDGRLLDETNQTTIFDGDARGWSADQGPPSFHSARRFFDVDHTVSVQMLDYVASVEVDPPKYVIANSFYGVVTGFQSIGSAVGQGTHCSTWALDALQEVGLSQPISSFASPASIIEAINGVDIPNNDDEIMDEIQSKIQTSLRQHVLDAAGQQIEDARDAARDAIDGVRSWFGDD